MFAELERKVAAKRAAGIDVISLGIGDPDMPTGDLPPPSGTGTGTETGTYRGHGTTGGITEAVPTKRWGLWAHWKVAMKLYARHAFLLR